MLGEEVVRDNGDGEAGGLPARVGWGRVCDGAACGAGECLTMLRKKVGVAGGLGGRGRVDGVGFAMVGGAAHVSLAGGGGRGGNRGVGDPHQSADEAEEGLGAQAAPAGGRGFEGEASCVGEWGQALAGVALLHKGLLVADRDIWQCVCEGGLRKKK